MIRTTSALVTVTLGSLLMAQSPIARADTFRCESRGGNYQSCPVDTRGGVRLSRQLSSQGCWQNDTWGYDRNRIWVARGCRAEFDVGNSYGSSNNGKNAAVAGAVVLGLIAAAAIASKNKDKDRDRYDDGYYNNNGYNNGYGNNGYGNNNYGNPRQTFTCESRGGNFTYCNQNAYGHVEIYKQLSSAQCNYGQSWGTERNRVWVSNGCRAEFAVY